MYKIQRWTVVVATFLGLVACAEKSPELPKNNQKPRYDAPLVHGDVSGQKGVPSGLDEVIKKKILPDFPSMTIGQAFQNYGFFSKQEWSQTRSANDTYYIDCIGWFDTKLLDLTSIKNGIARQGVGFKFMIAQNGTFGLVMVSRIEAMTDGKIYSYPLEDARRFIAKIYEKKEIKF
jgi:hypothetical protein